MTERAAVGLLFAMLTGCAVAPPQAAEVAEPPSRRTVDPCEPVTLPLQCGPLAAPSHIASIDEGVRTCETACTDGEVRSGAYRAVRLSDPPTVTVGAFERGRRDGQWVTRLHDDRGPILLVEHFAQGPRHGRFERRYPRGTMREVGAYHRDKPHGRWTVHAPDGVVVSEETYVRGRLVGTAVTRHPNGQRAAERNYDESGRPDGRWCSWLPDGREIECSTFVDGTGVAREFDETGTMVREVSFEEGEQHGVEVRIEGSRRVEIPWRRGVQTGVRSVVVGDCIAEETVVENTVPDGPHVQRDCDTGVVLSEGRYCGGHYCGLWIERRKDGSVARVLEYDPLSMKLAEASFADGKLTDFWTMDERLRLQRAACYQALVGGLCCEIEAQYRVSADCLTDQQPDTTEL